MARRNSPTAYVLIAHGSREAKSNRAFLRMVRLLRPLVAGAGRGAPVIGAFLDLARPTIPEALERAVKAGVRDIVVVPLLLFPGRHAARDIPAFVREATRKHRGVRFRATKPLALYPEFLTFLKEVL